MKRLLKILIISTIASTSSIPLTASAMKLINQNKANPVDLVDPNNFYKYSENEKIIIKIFEQLKQFKYYIKKYENEIDEIKKIISKKQTDYKKEKPINIYQQNPSELSDQFQRINELIKKLYRYYEFKIRYCYDHNELDNLYEEMRTDVKKILEAIGLLGFNFTEMEMKKYEEIKYFDKKISINEENSKKGKNFIEKSILERGRSLCLEMCKNAKAIMNLYYTTKFKYNNIKRLINEPDPSSNYNNIEKVRNPINQPYVFYPSIDEVFNAPKEKKPEMNYTYYAQQENLNSKIGKENNLKINEEKIKQIEKLNRYKAGKHIIGERLRKINKQVEEITKIFIEKEYYYLFDHPLDRKRKGPTHTQLERMLKKLQELEEEISTFNADEKLKKIAEEIRPKIKDTLGKEYSDDKSELAQMNLKKEVESYLAKENYKELKELKNSYEAVRDMRETLSRKIEIERRMFRGRYDLNTRYNFGAPKIYKISPYAPEPKHEQVIPENEKYGYHRVRKIYNFLANKMENKNK